MGKTVGENFHVGDGNEAAASVAYRTAEVIAIYPITPSSPMAEFCDEWAAVGKKNFWGAVPSIAEMQSEAGVAGAVHGALLCGSPVTTFTASQGLLLMIPNMYKIAGELIPFCMHVSARAIATHALSIFGDHSDVMACRATGFAMLASNSVQESHDFAAIATAATYESRIPFLHFFDGFRTSHELNGYETISDDALGELISPLAVEAFRLRALNPNQPTCHGTAQNPDVFFQGRERSNSFYEAVPDIVGKIMARFGEKTGRHYGIFDYVGAADGDIVFVAMGSGTETIEKTISELNGSGARLGLVKVHLFRPFSAHALASALPKSARHIIVLDRTKEPGALGEPLYLDVVAATAEARMDGKLPVDFNAKIYGGRYGLGSKEFSPSMAKGIVDACTSGKLKKHFTVGIEDDVTHISVPHDRTFRLKADEDCFSALFFGLGSDGTVGANKNTIKIIGSETDNYAQAYFVYDSKKSGGVTVSHLRFGPNPIRAPYLVDGAKFIGCHQFQFLGKFDILGRAAQGGVFLLNAPYGPSEIAGHLPQKVIDQIVNLNLHFYVIDAYAVAHANGMERRINTIMQTVFFAISGVLPRERAIEAIKNSIEKTYSKKGKDVIEKNFACVDNTLARFFPVTLSNGTRSQEVNEERRHKLPYFVENVTVPLLNDLGELLPVSAMPVDGTWPTDTVRYEKRSVAQEIPLWDPSLCVQCNRCALVCPHAAIRVKFFEKNVLDGAPQHFKSMDFRSKERPNCKFTVQVAPEDCTGCGLCLKACLGKSRTEDGKKAIAMQPKEGIVESERENFEFFCQIASPAAADVANDIRGSQFHRPLFEFSGACAGCGETAYIKLLTQLFGDRLIIANATGCSSIYGGNLPTSPYCKNTQGRGPAWANSLFEDNAEFGLGMALAVEKQRQIAEELFRGKRDDICGPLIDEILCAEQNTQIDIDKQRERVERLRGEWKKSRRAELIELCDLAERLVRKSVWVIGGDGWAYDIGFGGLDHAIASGKNVKILVLDTEVYSNTGGQQSKSTPIGAVAKFASAGKSLCKKDLGRMAMCYGTAYVAQVSLGAKENQTLKALQEAESYGGPALIIAYCPCISHGYAMEDQLDHQKEAVASGYWPLYRFDPRRSSCGENPLQIDSLGEDGDVASFMAKENRFSQLTRSQPDRSKELTDGAKEFVATRKKIYEAIGESKT
ncbi:MAG: pyruvate:ferredoxin (flavodoxin) oxidoreductase [Puniceicoccales bacterium]|jgi:pyruvate-ferredoxin/flavodoxin oxidoreductase|nr:pyruvate:ferredoxin (flavodoxin) oxidoreductase [Puniceicoccales bacterium]